VVAVTGAAAVAFVWLGMVLAISFVEAPLKFRAPDVTIRIGLGIGRLVFKALNGIECALAVAVIVLTALGRPGTGAIVSLVVVLVVLAVQLAAVRPALNRRSDAVLAGDDSGRRSRVHLVYVALELVKVAGLIVFGILAIG
jgi:hypothetical protein